MDQRNPEVSVGQSAKPQRVSRLAKLAISYLVAVVCLVWVFHDVRLRDLFREFKAISWWWVAPAIFFDIMSYLCQGIRWSLLLHHKGPLTVLQATQAIYAGLFVNEILPMRIGEVLRIYLASRWLTTEFTTVVSSVLVERFFDGIWLALAVGLTILIVPLPKYLVDAERLLAAIVFVGTIIFVSIVLRPRHSHTGRERDTRFSRFGMVNWLSKTTRELGAGIHQIGRSRYLFASLGVSAMLLVFQILAFWIAMLGYGFHLSVWHGAAILLILHLGTAIPGAPSNVGTFQFFTVLGLTQFGIDKTAATGFSVWVFLVLTLPLWVIGMLAFARAGLSLRGLRAEMTVFPKQ